LTSLLSAYDAALIAEDLYENMLPRCEVTFREELRLWHPEINPRRYLDTRSYPRVLDTHGFLDLRHQFPGVCSTPPRIYVSGSGRPARSGFANGKSQ